MSKREIGQDELKYVYESAKKRMEYHPDFAEKYKKLLKDIPVYKNIDEAKKVALDMENKGRFASVWANVANEEEYYYIQDHFIVSDNNFVLQAAEYVGMIDLPLHSEVVYPTAVLQQ